MPNSTKRTIHDIDYKNDDLLINKQQDQQDDQQHANVDLEIKEPLCKRQKKSLNVRFDSVNVYYFDRQQGFTCIPSTGLNTIGNLIF
jgi:hypothetical protein